MTVPDWATYVFNYSDFVPRGQCGKWDDPWLALYMHSHMIIFASYLGIGLVLLATLRYGKATGVELSKGAAGFVTITYACFIIFCGGAHFIDGNVVFQYPAYRAITLYLCWLALVSFSAFVATIMVRNRFIAVFR